MIAELGNPHDRFYRLLAGGDAGAPRDSAAMLSKNPEIAIKLDGN